ncbi:MAG: NIPSNAP family protein [Flavobacteriaceae bacterium]
MNKTITTLLLLFVFTLSFGQKEYYELRTYTIPFFSDAQPLHDYLSDALLPALNRQGIENIGVFKPLGDEHPQRIVLLIPYKSMASYESTLAALKKDATFQEDRKEYDQVPASNPSYGRFSSSFYIAFDGLPQIVKPEKGTQLFELRTYEGYSEDAVRRKIKMFNKEELSIFDQTGLHSVFFGEQVSGPLMPALTYMLSFQSMEERDANWEKFAVHPEWKRISVLPEYANSVSDIKRTFLQALDYSQL